MSTIPMPEPVARVHVGNPVRYEHIDCWCLDVGTHDLITTTQAEAYADARVKEAQQWLPIETAPKDGTDIMLTDGTHVTVGHWHYEAPSITEHRDLDGRWIGQDESGGYEGWLDWIGGIPATHWMPLPAPPQQ